MSLQVDGIPFWDIGPMIQLVRTEFIGMLINQFYGVYTAVDWGMTTVDGKPAFFIFHSQEPDFDQMVYYALVNWDEGMTIPARNLVNAPGAAGVQHEVAFPDFDPPLTVGELEDMFVLDWLPTLEDLILTLTNAEECESTSAMAIAVPDSVYKLTTNTKITGPADVVNLNQELLIDRQFVGEEVHWSTYPATYVGPNPAPTTILPTARIVSALKDLALGDADISLNYGATVYSIRTKLITE